MEAKLKRILGIVIIMCFLVINSFIPSLEVNATEVRQLSSIIKITQQPKDTSYKAGETVKLSVVAEGSGLKYQ